MMFELYLQNLFLFQIPDDNQLFVLFNSCIKILKHFAWHYMVQRCRGADGDIDGLAISKKMSLNTDCMSVFNIFSQLSDKLEY